MTPKNWVVPQVAATRTGCPLPVIVTAPTENPARCAKLLLCRYSLNSGSDADISIIPRGANVFHILTIRGEFRYGRGRNRSESTTLKIAVVAPIPTARVITQTVVKTAFLTSCRIAYLTSCDRRSNGTHPQASRVCSLTRTSLPKARRAA